MAPSSYAADYIEMLNRGGYATTSYGKRRTYALEPERRVAPKKERGKKKDDAHLTLAQGRAMQHQIAVISPAVLIKTMALLCFVGIILIMTVWLGAKATEVQYRINSLNRENIQLEDEITMLGIKVQGAVSFESVEEYATSTLKMKYPKSSQCIYIDAEAKADANLISVIREKAYGG